MRNVMLVIMVFLAGHISLYAEPPQRDIVVEAEKLRSKDRAERDTARVSVLRKVDRLESELLETLRTRDSYLQTRRDAAISAIEILGRLRSHKAVPLLVEMIDFEAVKGMKDREERRRTPVVLAYPAVGALVQIGDWSSVLNSIGNAGIVQKQDLLLKVLKETLGADLADDALGHLVVKQTDAKAKSRLRVIRSRLKLIN